MTEQLAGQMSIFDLDIWCGKMYQEPLAQIKEKILEPCLKKPQKWPKGMPAFLDLRGGRWPAAGCIMGAGWSIAWRVHDAQFWGVPQRRKRIALVADFGGESASEILFERKGLPRDFKKNADEREKAARSIGKGIKETSKGLILFEPRSQDGVPRIHGDISPTLNTAQGGQRQPCVVLEGNGSRPSHKGDGYAESDISYTLNAVEKHAICYRGDSIISPIVRRLTPMECERLQGYPDRWTDIGEWYDSKGKKHKDADSPRYKALGNSIAVGYANGKSGFWCWMAGRMVNQLRQAGVDKPTMASLFDGIGGFPLAYSAYGCKPVWASEIEEFPIAVTKIRFPENECEEAQNG